MIAWLLVSFLAATTTAPSTRPATTPATRPADATIAAEPWPNAAIDAGRVNDLFELWALSWSRGKLDDGTATPLRNVLMFNVRSRSQTTIAALEARFYDADERLIGESIVRFDPLVIQWKPGTIATGTLVVKPEWMQSVRRIELLPL